jgi:cob(I)alamin adenosyltransferase
MKIYTKRGDGGRTSLFGGKEASKHDVRLHAVGTIDELNALIGVTLTEPDLPNPVREHLQEIQNLLFRIGADLATPPDQKGNIRRTIAADATTLETWIDTLSESLPPLTQFILPGGTRSAALLHQARTICRRAERWIVALHDQGTISAGIVPVINRLSDYLFTAARAVNLATKTPETTVQIPRSTK